MLIKNAKRTENSGWEFGISSSEDEVAFLVNYAIIDLIQKGILKLAEDMEIQEVDVRSLKVEGGLH